MGWECSLVVEHLHWVHKAMDLSYKKKKANISKAGIKSRHIRQGHCSLLLKKLTDDLLSRLAWLLPT
jgi:hypothetical protein